MHVCSVLVPLQDTDNTILAHLMPGWRGVCLLLLVLLWMSSFLVAVVAWENI